MIDHKKLAHAWLSKQAGGTVQGSVGTIRFNQRGDQAEAFLWVTFRDTKMIPLSQFTQWANTVETAAKKLDQNLRKSGARIAFQGPPMVYTDRQQIKIALRIDGPPDNHELHDLIVKAMHASGIASKRGR